LFLCRLLLLFLLWLFLLLLLFLFALILIFILIGWTSYGLWNFDLSNLDGSDNEVTVLVSLTSNWSMLLDWCLLLLLLLLWSGLWKHWLGVVLLLIVILVVIILVGPVSLGDVGLLSGFILILCFYHH